MKDENDVGPIKTPVTKEFRDRSREIKERKGVNWTSGPLVQPQEGEEYWHRPGSRGVESPVQYSCCEKSCQ